MGQDKNILVVDDDEFILYLVSNALKKEGFRVLCAATFAEAMLALESENIHLLVSDLLLPDSNGRSLGRFVHGHASLNHIPVILVTGADKSVIEEESKTANAVLAKPFDLKQLIALGRSFLESETGSAV
jgi:DNA-binding response OmpR family regulator